MANEKKLFLLDAYALIFRAYYAFINNQIVNSKGLNTSAIYGFAATLDEILQKERPSHIGVVFDTPTPTFRHIMYPAYKATRDATPEEIKVSIPWIKKLIGGFNIPVLELPGYEADDLIGTLAKKAESQGFTVFMMTPDKDYAQLVSERIFIYKPRRSGNDAELIGLEQVREKFNIQDPLQVIDVMALWGDSSDNVPGAPGIGEKTAKKLISEYKSVENLFEHSSELKGKQQESIINNQKQIELSKELVTIITDVPVEFREEELIYSGPDQEKLQSLFEELEFRTLAKRILSNNIKNESNTSSRPQSKNQQASLFDDDNLIIQGSLFGDLASLETVDHKYELIEEDENIRTLVDKMLQQDCICFDTETTSINALEADLVGIAFCWKEHEACYVPFPDKREDACILLEKFRTVFEKESLLKVGQNLKYDIQVLANYNLAVKGPLFDTMIAHYLLQPDQKHGLDHLSAIYLKYKPVSIEELIGKKGSTQANMRQVPLETISQYACEDADLTWQLYQILKKDLSDAKIENLARNMEFPLISVLGKMEKEGINLDVEALEKFAKILTQDLISLEEEIFKLAGVEFNISSPKQMGEILFDRLKIITDAKKTSSKQYSTGEEVLSRLTDKHPIVNKVLEFRTLKKLLSTYVETLPKLISPKSGRIHTSYNQAVAATGRLSSNNPNMQNIPIREERGREIRKAFIPRDDHHVLFSADYSQIELRLMAHMSRDEVMIEAFRNNEDIHTATAAKLFNIPIENVSREQRGKAKTANFGIIYGISAFGLAQRMMISRQEAKELIDGYFQTYKKIRLYMDESIRHARETGYVETLLKRRRYLRDINSRNAVVRGFAERNAINAPIQGSAADIIKIAMVNIQNRIEQERLNSKMILQVHDELIFDVPREESQSLRELVIREMEQAYTLNVPLVVDSGEGNNWLEAH